MDRANPDGGQHGPSDRLVNALKGLQRPTWELELLISGALIFSLFQLPGVLTDWFGDLVGHVSGSAYWTVYWIYYAGMMIAVVLTITFSVHFLLRAFWVGLCGLNAVFPGEVDLEEVDIGPIARTVYSIEGVDTTRLERRVDALASATFSALSVLLISVLILIFYVALLGGAVWLIANRVAGGSDAGHFIIAFLIIWVPLTLVGIADWIYKKQPQRWDEQGPAGRTLVRIYRVYYWAMLMPLWGPISLTYLTRFSQRTIMVLSFVVGLGLPLIASVVMLSGIGAWGYDSYVYFPTYAEGATVHPRHYETMRDPVSRAPFIQSDMISDPFVRLVVPFWVDDDSERVEEECAELSPLRTPGLFRSRARTRAAEQPAESEILDCLARLFEVELNGDPIDDLEWLLYNSPLTRMRGLVAYLPAQDLPRGRSEIVVRRTLETTDGGADEAEAPDEEEGPDDDARPRAYHIPFWR
jgi:MFS family permease